jgi:chlorobactene glucosyltransferase
LIYQIIITAGLVIFALNLILNLKALRRPKKDSTIPESAPLISVLIPARNEEANIEACVKSLQKQDYPNFEIIVLDDNSRDRTASIVRQMASTDNRIQLLRGTPLPQGWAGKPFACHQLAERAKGSWLLFVDADTTSATHMLRSVMALALEMKPSLLSGFPRQLTTFLPQKIAIPILFYFLIMSWFPLWWLQRSKKPKPSLAIGQFLLFPRDEYWRIGGHKAVKGKILEDVWLGVETIRHGGRHVAIDLSPVFSCSMYHSIKTMSEGVIKWMYSVASLSSAALVALMVAGYVFFLAPFYWLWHELFMVTAPTAARPLIIFQVALIIGLRLIVDLRFKNSPISAWLHPIGFFYVVLSALYSTIMQIIGKGISWKERVYDEGSGVK